MIHRRVGDADLYFVSNQDPFPAAVSVTFRAGERRPELLEPDSGRIVPAARYAVKDGLVTVPLHFDPAGSTFVVFRRPVGAADPVVSLTRDGRPVDAEVAAPKARIVVERAVYGVNPETNARSVDITRQVSKAVRNGRLRIIIGNSIAGDPAQDVVKRALIKYTINGVRKQVALDENGLLDLPAPADRAPDAKPEPPAPEVTLAGDRGLTLRVSSAGRYEARTASSRTVRATVADLPAARTVEGAWDLQFPLKWGAPEHVTLGALESWTANADEGVRHFSGTATYRREIDVPAAMLARGRAVFLDLGSVREVAEVKLNGVDLGILWKPPYRVDITRAARPGSNHLAVRITNLWPNRMIGDAALPLEKRFTYATFQPFKPDDPLLESGLLGPVTLQPLATVTLK